MIYIKIREVKENKKCLWNMFAPLMTAYSIYNTGLIGVMYLSWPTSRPSLKILGQCVLKLLIRQGFEQKCHYDLDLWPKNPKFNMVHLLVMTNHHNKKKDPRSMCSQIIIPYTRKVSFTQKHKQKPLQWVGERHTQLFSYYQRGESHSRDKVTFELFSMTAYIL